MNLMPLAALDEFQGHHSDGGVTGEFQIATFSAQAQAAAGDVRRKVLATVVDPEARPFTMGTNY